MANETWAQAQADETLKRQLSTDTADGVESDFQALAAAGSAQTDAGQITVASNGLVVVSAADGTKGVILPKPTRNGYVVHIKNNVNAVLKVYPATGGIVNALSANAAISQAALTAASYRYSLSADAWYTFPLLPS